jgi:hypothetical protein
MISGGRTQGVVTTTSRGNQGTGVPKTVESIFKLEQFLVKFYDEMGDGHLDILVKIGDEYFASPYGEEWCTKLGPAMIWIKAEVARRVASKEKGTDTSSIPEKDAVTISPSTVHDRLVKETQGYVSSQASR